MGSARSALLVPVPEAEEAVAGFRRRLDPSAGLGVPAHVTLRYPFVAPDELGEGVLAALASLLAGFAPFAFRLSSLGWFGEDVLYLAPEPDTTFRAGARALAGRFPEPGGQDRPLVPHLTVASGAPRPAMEAAAAELAGLLPIHAVADSVWLMVGAGHPRSWATFRRFELGGPAPAG